MRLLRRGQQLAVGDHLILSTSTLYQQTPGSVLAAAGVEVDDEDAFYLLGSREHMIWPYDDQGRLVGEDVWEPDPSQRQVIKLEPGEELTVRQSAALLEPLIKPLPALVA